ncbi:MAG TPA: META domain-containing protein, partial [Desulfomonilia bacterium]|nr:META domain-containing protein [Desulfomonilia bacterium]
SVKLVVLACSIMIVATACTPFTRIQGDDKTSAKIKGSWTVIWSGGAKLEGVTPRPTIVFNSNDNTVSGFDGCNNYTGTYSFVGGHLKATVSGTRMACPNETARAVSEQMANLFTNGAEVVETSFMGAHVLLMKNSSAELRLGPSDQVQ